MSKRVSGPPRRPRNPVAKAVRTTSTRQQIVPDKRQRQTDLEKLAEIEREQQKKGAEEKQDEPLPEY